MEGSDTVPGLAIGSIDSSPTVVEVEGSSDSPPTALKVEDSSDNPSTKVEDSSGSPPAYTFHDLEPTPGAVVQDSCDDPPDYTYASPVPVEMKNSSGSPPAYQALIIGNDAGPPPYMCTDHPQINIDVSSDRPPAYIPYVDQALNNGHAATICAPAPVETRSSRKYRCYLSIVLVLMCLSVLMMNPVAFMLAVGALVHVLQYNHTVNTVALNLGLVHMEWELYIASCCRRCCSIFVVQKFYNKMIPSKYKLHRN